MVFQNLAVLDAVMPSSRMSEQGMGPGQGCGSIGNSQLSKVVIAHETIDGSEALKNWA
jgi:hypothetical protein